VKTTIPLVDLSEQFQGLKKEIMAEIGGALDGMGLFLGENAG
jgi:hypothetical protein